MTDQQIIEGLINKDKHITEEFFFERCKPLFCSIISTVFGHKVEYDELVNELYLYLMADNASKLKSFQFGCSIFQWLKVVAIRFFIKLRDHGGVIEDESQEAHYENLDKATMETVEYNNARDDLIRLLGVMPNQRYAFVIKRLVLEEMEPEQLSKEMGITVANLYNIKKRAIRQLTEVAMKDIEEYGKH